MLCKLSCGHNKRIWPLDKALVIVCPFPAMDTFIKRNDCMESVNLYKYIHHILVLEDMGLGGL